MATRSKSVAVVLVVLSVLFVHPETSAAQVEARQGDAKEERPNDFTSPMVLELPLPDLSAWPDGELVQYREEIRDFFCDDVSIHELVLIRRKTRGPEETGEVMFRIEGKLYTRPSHDREVTMEVVILKDGEAIAEAHLKDVESEEKKRMAFRKKLTVPRSRLEKAFSSEPAPVLKITLWVRDDR